MIKTAGGRYDPDEGFSYFLAGMLNVAGIAEHHVHNLVAVNDLFSETSRAEFRALIARPEQKMLLDSGVFWLATQHAERNDLTMDEALSLPPATLDGWEALTGAFVELARAHEADLWGYVELDQGGARWKRETRAWLESEGLRPIPVYHPLTDGWDYLDELLDAGYDRLMVGNVVQAGWAVRDRIVLTVWERVQQLPRERRPWLHLLGLGPYPTLAACRFDSADTSNHVQSMRYGAIVPGGLAMGPFSKLRGYLYDAEEGALSDRDLAAYGRLLGWVAAHEERTWRVQEEELLALLGDEFPEFDAPVPEAALA